MGMRSLTSERFELRSVGERKTHRYIPQRTTGGVETEQMRKRGFRQTESLRPADQYPDEWRKDGVRT